MLCLGIEPGPQNGMRWWIHWAMAVTNTHRYNFTSSFQCWDSNVRPHAFPPTTGPGHLLGLRKANVISFYIIKESCDLRGNSHLPLSTHYVSQYLLFSANRTYSSLFFCLLLIARQCRSEGIEPTTIRSVNNFSTLTPKPNYAFNFDGMVKSLELPKTALPIIGNILSKLKTNLNQSQL